MLLTVLLTGLLLAPFFATFPRWYSNVSNVCCVFCYRQRKFWPKNQMYSQSDALSRFVVMFMDSSTI